MRTLLLAACCLLVVPLARGEPSLRPNRVDAALTDMLRGPSAAFAGVQRSTVFLDDGARVTVEVRVSGDGHGAVRREYRSGALAGAVVLQRDGRGWQRSPAGAWTRLPDAPPVSAAATAARLLANYAASVGKPARLAGRPVVRIDLRPRQAFCPSRSAWVDRGKGLIVRDEMRAPDGALRSVSELTAVSFGPQPPGQFAAPRAAVPSSGFGPASFDARASLAAVERETGRAVPVPTHVPAGFRPVTYGVMTTGSGRLMPAVRYSDGLAAFTIFERGGGYGQAPGWGGGGPGYGRGRGMGRGPGWGRQQRRGTPGARGQCLAMTDGRQQAVVEWQGGQCGYLLVGEIAAGELRRVAETLP